MAFSRCGLGFGGSRPSGSGRQSKGTMAGVPLALLVVLIRCLFEGCQRIFQRCRNSRFFPVISPVTASSTPTLNQRLTRLDASHFLLARGILKRSKFKWSNQSIHGWISRALTRLETIPQFPRTERHPVRLIVASTPPHLMISISHKRPSDYVGGGHIECWGLGGAISV